MSDALQLILEDADGTQLETRAPALR